MHSLDLSPLYLRHESCALSVQLRFAAEAFQLFTVIFLSIVGPPATDDEDSCAYEDTKYDCDNYACYCAAREFVREFWGALTDFCDILGYVVFGEYRD